MFPDTRVTVMDIYNSHKLMMVQVYPEPKKKKRSQFGTSEYYNRKADKVDIIECSPSTSPTLLELVY